MNDQVGFDECDPRDESHVWAIWKEGAPRGTMCACGQNALPVDFPGVGKVLFLRVTPL